MHRILHLKSKHSFTHWASLMNFTNGTREHGGKENHTATTKAEITSQYIYVCKVAISVMCFSKIQSESTQQAKRSHYALCNSMRPKEQIFNQYNLIFSIKSSRTPYSLSICARTVEVVRRRASGYQVKFLDRQICLSLLTPTKFRSLIIDLKSLHQLQQFIVHTGNTQHIQYQNLILNHR